MGKGRKREVGEVGSPVRSGSEVVGTLSRLRKQEEHIVVGHSRRPAAGRTAHRTEGIGRKVAGSLHLRTAAGSRFAAVGTPRKDRRPADRLTAVLDPEGQRLGLGRVGRRKRLD